MELLSDGSFFLVGHEHNVNPKPFVIATLSSSGFVSSAKSLVHSNDDISLNSVTTSSDGFIYMTGTLGNYMVIVKMTSAGNMDWIKSYEFNEET